MFGAFSVFACLKGLGICFVAHNAMNMGRRRHIVDIIVQCLGLKACYLISGN